jgi:hypothetical protein
MTNDEPLTKAEIDTLLAAGYKPRGGGVEGDRIVVRFAKDGDVLAATRGAWRALIAELKFPTERRDDGIHSEIFVFLEDGPLRHWSAHRVLVSRYDLADNGEVTLPEPHIMLVGFSGTLSDFPRYIASLQELERQARALREEKQAEYREWRETVG